MARTDGCLFFSELFVCNSSSSNFLYASLPSSFAASVVFTIGKFNPQQCATMGWMVSHDLNVQKEYVKSRAMANIRKSSLHFLTIGFRFLMIGFSFLMIGTFT